MPPMLRSFFLILIIGPSPHTALALIDRLGLYNTIYTNPSTGWFEMANTQHWHLAYDQLHAIVTQVGGTNSLVSLQVIAKILLKEPHDAEEVYLAWMLCCFVPWAQTKTGTSNPPISKFPKTVAAIAAREGIKADNNITKLVEEAVLYFPDVVIMKGDTINQNRSSTFRELHGRAIRQWGPHWRSIVIFALLIQIAQTQNQSGASQALVTERNVVDSYLKYAGRQDLLDSYAAWLSGLAHLDLLNVHQMKPIINGKQICAALAAKPGPWTKQALDIALGWQLRNPDETSPNGCLEEVLRRKNELDLV